MPTWTTRTGALPDRFGCKQSRDGRGYGKMGIAGFLEVKALVGTRPTIIRSNEA